MRMTPALAKSFLKERNHRRADRLGLLQRGEVPGFLNDNQGSIRQSSCNLPRLVVRYRLARVRHLDNQHIAFRDEWTVNFARRPACIGARFKPLIKRLIIYPA